MIIEFSSSETTKGVYQASGYGDITSKKSVWYDPHLPTLA
jgi:hypothetical protein